MLNILQARFQQYMNQELPDVQVGFRKGKQTRDQIVNIHWIIEKARALKKKKKIYICFTDYTEAFECGSQQTVEYFERDGSTRPLCLPPEKPVCRTRSNS